MLSFDFLIDLLAIVDRANRKKGSGDKMATLDSVELEGITPGFDPVLQTYTFVENNYIFFVHYGTNTFDIACYNDLPSLYLRISACHPRRSGQFENVRP